MEPTLPYPLPCYGPLTRWEFTQVKQKLGKFADAELKQRAAELTMLVAELEGALEAAQASSSELTKQLGAERQAALAEARFKCAALAEDAAVEERELRAAHDGFGAAIAIVYPAALEVLYPAEGRIGCTEESRAARYAQGSGGGEEEEPAGEKDVGGWSMPVFTQNQQARLCVDESGARDEARSTAERGAAAEARAAAAAAAAQAPPREAGGWLVWRGQCCHSLGQLRGNTAEDGGRWMARAVHKDPLQAVP